jgi:RecB family endonuclease NucS
MFQETDKQIGELSRNIGGLNNTFGKWAEEMVSAKLWEKFRAIGYTFTHCGPREFWEGDRMVVQVDMLLENGEYAMVVEIKSKLSEEDVEEHLERIGKVRKELDKRGDRRKLVGAVAGMVVTGEVRKYAQKRGLYVLVQSGNSAALAESPEGFKAREW